MVRSVVMLVVMLWGLTGCFAPKAQVMVRNWRPLGASGLTLAQLLAVSPGCKRVTWESYAESGTATTVRVSVEYDPGAALVACPATQAGMARAARLFLLLDCDVAKDGGVSFHAATAQVYDTAGYYESYSLDIGVMASIVAKAFPLPCADIGLPSYL